VGRAVKSPSLPMHLNQVEIPGCIYKEDNYSKEG